MSEGSKAPVWIIAAVGGCGCLLLLTAVGGVIAAIVIPNFVDATERARQKRTVAEVRNVGTAWLSWVVDQDTEDLGRELPPGAVGPERLRELLTPTYIDAVPTVDGWGHPLEYTVLGSGSLEGPLLQIRSPGRDGVFETPPEGEIAFPPGEAFPVDFDRDLVWRDGTFVQSPATP